MEEENLTKEETISKIKLIYILFFAAMFVFLFVFFVFEAYSPDAGILNKILGLIPFVIFVVAGMMAFNNYSSKEKGWANEQLFWLRNTFLVMLGALIISKLPDVMFYFLKVFNSANMVSDIVGSTNSIRSLSFFLGVLLFIFGVWFVYRIVQGFIRFLTEKSPYNSLADIKKYLESLQDKKF